MKKILIALFILFFACPENSFGQFDFLGADKNEKETTANEKFMKNNIKAMAKKSTGKEEEPAPQQQPDFFSGFINEIEAAKNAKIEAKQMLQGSPNILKLRSSKIKELEKNRIEREKLRQKFLTIEQERLKPEEKIQNILNSLEVAPLGLRWAISPDEMKEIGYEIEEITRDDYPNSYIIKNYEKKGGQGYKNVVVSFGTNSALWCINAQTTGIEDEDNAKETLKAYKKYYDALAGKYGNATEFFTPYTYEKEIIEGEGEEAVTRTIKKENPKGNPNFLKELQTGKAELYATFHNNNIGVTLSVYVDENGEGQLILDYKNLKLLRKEKEAFVNNL